MSLHHLSPPKVGNDFRGGVAGLNRETEHYAASAIREAVSTAQQYGGFTEGGYFAIASLKGIPLYVTFQGKVGGAGVEFLLGDAHALAKGMSSCNSNSDSSIQGAIKTRRFIMVFTSANPEIDEAIVLLTAMDMGEMDRDEARLIAEEHENTKFMEIISEMNS